MRKGRRKKPWKKLMDGAFFVPVAPVVVESLWDDAILWDDSLNWTE